MNQFCLESFHGLKGKMYFNRFGLGANVHIQRS